MITSTYLSERHFLCQLKVTTHLPYCPDLINCTCFCSLFLRPLDKPLSTGKVLGYGRLPCIIYPFYCTTETHRVFFKKSSSITLIYANTYIYVFFPFAFYTQDLLLFLCVKGYRKSNRIYTCTLVFWRAVTSCIKTLVQG